LGLWGSVPMARSVMTVLPTRTFTTPIKAVRARAVTTVAGSFDSPTARYGSSSVCPGARSDRRMRTSGHYVRVAPGLTFTPSAGVRLVGLWLFMRVTRECVPQVCFVTPGAPMTASQ
jgi:hypothetical protein